MTDFIKHCLQIDPTQRMTCEEAIRHEWFKDLLKETEAEINEALIERQEEREIGMQMAENVGSLVMSSYELSPNNSGLNKSKEIKRRGAFTCTISPASIKKQCHKSSEKI